MRSTLRWPLTLLLIASLSCAPGTSGNERDRRVLQALERSLVWLEKHPVPTTETIGKLGFDAWSWYLFSAWHPDAEVQERAGAEVDRRLRALKPPPAWDQVSISYWATLLRIAKLRGVELPSEPAVPAGAELERVLRPATPTTAYWIEELLRHSGLPVEPDTAGNLLETGPASLPNYTPTVADAYGIFHELVPATGLGVTNFEITRVQAEFIRSALPGWIDVCRAKLDTDALAELLVVMALMDERNAAYDDTLDWLLSRQREDGTYVVPNSSGRVDDFRHVVLVASWALLASLDSFETRIEVAE